MALSPVEVSLEIAPSSRFDIIDVSKRVTQEFDGILQNYKKSLYCSFHTTAGYFEQSLAARLQHNKENVDPFISAFRGLFPEDADYHHDQMQFRSELTEEQKINEPKNADSHLIYISSGLKNCVTYTNQPDQPVYFIELDGVYKGQVRSRKTNVLAFNNEKTAAKMKIEVPVSNHPIDSINLNKQHTEHFEQINDVLREKGIQKGRVNIALSHNETHAGLTVNEYETLLMRHDLAEVLNNPLKFVAQQGKHMLLDIKAIPSKTRNYAKYDLVHVFNGLIDAFRVRSSVVEKILSKFIAYPAARFLRMKRGVSMLVSNQENGVGQIVHGTYQSPILVQWDNAQNGVRMLDVEITEFQ